MSGLVTITSLRGREWISNYHFLTSLGGGGGGGEGSGLVTITSLEGREWISSYNKL